MAAKVEEALVDVLERLAGKHAGFRRAHAKGIVCEGTFAPSSAAAGLSRAPHFQGASVPILVRFSNGTGVPDLPDNDPQSSPRGMAVRFQLPGGSPADIVAHSFNGFPAATPQEFLQLLTAVADSAPGAPGPAPIAAFLAAHPRAAQFVHAPKPAPASFATESFFGVHAFRFTNREGNARHARYQIQPVAGRQHLGASEAAARGPNYLFDELRARLQKGPAQFGVVAQLAGEGDDVNVANVAWPDSRPQIALGTLSITRVLPDSDAQQRVLIFDPTHLADGIELSADPILRARAEVYSIAYGRRTAV